MLLVFLLFAAIASHAQADDSGISIESEDTQYDEASFEAIDPAELSTTKEYSNKNIKLHKFDEEKWKDVVGSTDYREGDAVQKSNEGGYGSGKKRTRIRSREERQESSSSSISISPFFAIILRLLFYAVIISVIGYILYLIVKNVSSRSNPKILAGDTTELSDEVEDIADLNIDTLLSQAQAAGNYRLVIRIYFLGLLKKLDACRLILWKKDKTNRDYLTELFSAQNYYQEVRRLTLAYEQVWYGDHSLSTELYQQLTEEFKAIDQRLNTTKAP